MDWNGLLVDWRTACLLLPVFSLVVVAICVFGPGFVKKRKEPDESHAKRKAEPGIAVSIVAAIALLVFVGRGVVEDYSKPKATPEPTKKVTYTRELTPEEQRIKRLKEAPPGEVEPEDYDDWCYYHPFQLDMFFDLWEPLNSTSIGAISYLREYKYLAIEFENHDNDIYVYTEIEPETYQKFLNSESAGQYYQQNIKGQYDVSKYSWNASTKKWEKAY